MNNKGFTVAELIITFVIVMTISIGLFTTVDSYRETQQQESYKKTVNNYLNEILVNIQDDVIKKGGIVNIEGLSVFQNDNDNACLGYNQGIKVTYRNNEDKYLCVGDGRLDSSKVGILYGGIFYRKPTNFLSFVDDIIFERSFDTEELPRKIWKISIKAKHSEIKEVFKIDVVSVEQI